ncbi:DNA replication/repair protein RecF [Brevibacterium sp. UMB10442]|nr:DNA replication/repair protein RecF [Brevibacterium sp. UMB10442]
MWVSQLRLRNFRSYESFDVALEQGVSTFVAPNGWGKTNLVEALAYVSHLKSHRVSQDLPLVRSGCDEATVAVLAHRGDRQLALEVTVRAKGANSARIQRSSVRPRELVGLLPCVVFAPEDLGLVKGEPAQRRDFLDDLLVTQSPRFVAVRADFDRALKQRNALLKELKSNRDPGLEATLAIWDEAFAEAASQLVVGRMDLVERLTQPLQNDFATLAQDANEDRKAVSATYTSRIDYSDIEDATDAKNAIIDALQSRRVPEIDRGLTLVGPQRDDLELEIGGVSAKHYASHGESWSVALALKLAGWHVLQEDNSGPDDSAVLVLDDVFAELDEGRRNRLAGMLEPAQQVLITAAVPGDVPESLHSTIIDLQDA